MNQIKFQWNYAKNIFTWLSAFFIFEEKYSKYDLPYSAAYEKNAPCLAILADTAVENML
jgi:hypothetical protein